MKKNPKIRQRKKKKGQSDRKKIGTLPGTDPAGCLFFYFKILNFVMAMGLFGTKKIFKA